MTLQCVQSISILRCAVAIGEGVLLGGHPLSLFDMLVTTTKRELKNLMFPLWFALLGGSFYSLYSPFFGCFGFCHDWQEFHHLIS